MKVLYIQQDQSKPTNKKDIFNIHEVLDDLSQKKKEELYSEYNSLSVTESCGIDRYEIISQYYALGRYGSLQQPMFLYDKLTEKIKEQDPDKVIVTKGVEEKYQEVIKDVVGDERRLKIDNKCDDKRVKKSLWSIIRLCYLLLEHLLHAIFHRPKRKTSDVVFILNRESSMRPVIHSASQKGLDHIVLSPKAKIKHIFHDGKLTDLNITNYITIEIWLREIDFFIKLIIDFFITSNFAEEVNQEFQSQLGRDMFNTINHTTNEIFASNLPEKFRYVFLTEAMVETIDCEKIVTSSFSPSGRAILQTAENKGVIPYHIPHSVITPNFSSIGKTQHFVCGKLDLDYLHSLPQVTDMSKYHPTGRPYFNQLYTNWESTENGLDGYLVTIATQPISNKHEFVRCVIKAAERTDSDIKIEIKIHPGEEAEEYQKYTSKNEGKVSVVDNKLFERISRSDLLLTRNSNVGLEAMIVGTPCVAANWWRPSQSDMSYILFGPVPVCERKQEVCEIFDKLDGSYLKELQRKQCEFVEENIQLSKDPSEQIVKHLTPSA